MFSQAGQAVKRPVGIDVLRGLKPKLVLALGESQSAGRLATYVNFIHPLAQYDGFLLLSSLGNRIRPDLTAPVLKVSTEYDVGQSEAAARQPDTAKFRAWEIAGTAHVDYHLRQSREPLELRDIGVSSEAALAPTCAVPTIGTRVPTRYAMASGLDKLVVWATKGTPLPSAPYLEIASFGPGNAATIAVDSFGLALGGIRLSRVAVPTAANVGTNRGPGACVRWGYYIPFDVQSGYVLEPDGDSTIKEADDSVIGQWNRLRSTATGRCPTSTAIPDPAPAGRLNRPDTQGRPRAPRRPRRVLDRR